MKMRKVLIKVILMSLSQCVVVTANANMPVIDVGAIYQLSLQLKTLKDQTELIKLQLQGLKSDQYHWSNAEVLMNNLGRVMNETNGIAYTASNLDSQFRTAFPGYKAPEDFAKSYRSNVNSTQNTFNGVLQSVGTSATDFQATETRMAFLQKQSSSAVGQTQAIQAATQITAEMVNQIQLLRQTVIAQTNAQAVYYASQVQNQANERADLEAIIKAGSTEIPAYGSSGNELTTPDFIDE